ncbi:MAG: N-acetylneuraminate synthase family protein [Treponema sp.]|jgi:sialic acid synthase SpsE|nr:N-acetylneuraminate synthase family protein [Treponema sp.]
MIIAEIGTAHGGSLKKAEDLITAAAEAGCDAVKFQWVYADEILHPETGKVQLPGGPVKLYDRFKSLEVEPAFFSHMKNFAHKKNVLFMCSPFGLKSLSELIKIEPDAIKIASPELNHFQLLSALNEARHSCLHNGCKPVPVILSSGISKLADIERALEILYMPESEPTLLHCITSYPAPEEEYNVRLVKTLAKIFGIKTGISDHSMDPVLVPSLAVSQGSTITEKHITLCRKTDGLDDPVALEPEQFALMTHDIHQAEAMLRHYGTELGAEKIIQQISAQYGEEKVQKVLGTGIKKLAPSEKQNYGRTNRSLHFLHTMKKGETLKTGDIAVLRTEKILTPGIGPEYLEFVIGARLQNNVKNGSGVQWTDIICRDR